MCFPVWDFRFEILDGDFYMAGKKFGAETCESMISVHRGACYWSRSEQ